MLFGTYDPAAAIVWIDAVSGPAPDSVLSEDYFRHGTAGTDALRASYRDSSVGATDFVGFWHNHPEGQAIPSPTDWAGMTGLVEQVPGCRYALMLILGGTGSTWQGWLEHGSGCMPEVYVRLVRRGEHVATPAGSGTVRRGPQGRSFPGGFVTAARPTGRPAQRRWWSILRRIGCR